jgi:hypothetical protein
MVVNGGNSQQQQPTTAPPPPPDVNNIMGGIEQTVGVRMHNHRRKLRQRYYAYTIRLSIFLFNAGKKDSISFSSSISNSYSHFHWHVNIQRLIQNCTIHFRFDLVRKLGQGTYGKVQLGINKETGQEVKVKIYLKKCPPLGFYFHVLINSFIFFAY